jgi:uncharacterized protein
VQTLLLLAARLGHDKILLLLLERGADIGYRNKMNGSRSQTALHLAVAAQHLSTVRLLLERDADVNASDGIGWTPLMNAVQNANAMVDNRIHQLLPLTGITEGDVWDDMRPGVNALSPTESECSGAIAHLLLEHGAQVEATDSLGHTALHQAARAGDFDRSRIPGGSRTCQRRRTRFFWTDSTTFRSCGWKI